MRADSTEPLVEVLVARDVTHAYLAKARLEDAGIFTVLQGENLQMLAGDIPPQEAAPRLLVRRPELARALQILEEHGERL
jgi:putative signal transducing protein